MRRLLPFVLLVPLVAGCGWLSAFSGGHTTVHSSPARIRVHPSAPSPVPRWVKVDEHLPRNAMRGAALFESAGCTVCHVYAGTGSTKLRAR